LADKLTPLILSALARAAAEPVGVALFASKAMAGLFPATVVAKAAAKRCLDGGLLRRLAPQAQGKATVEWAAITDKGLAYLLEAQTPKPVLEDLLRVLEERGAAVTDLLAQARTMAENLKGLQATLAAVLPKVVSARVTVLAAGDPAAEVLAVLDDWASAAGEDCPLPELYRRLPSQPSLGAFHDTLRKLHRAGRVYLHPWTAPLYTLPDPSFALLVGHEVTYYASTKKFAMSRDRQEAVLSSV
jgi:hypothetical protein